MYNDMEIKTRDERCRKFIAKHGASLWHYTDFNAMDGILNRKEIWFPSAANMNDTKELIGFIDDLENGVICSVDEEYKERVSELFKKIKGRLGTEYPYIFCTSKAKNDAAQWERYANDGKGVAIVFNTQKLYELIFYNEILMSEEYYTYSAKQHQFCELLTNYIQTGKIQGFLNLDEAIGNLFLCAMIHKHESFSSEQEIRLAPYFIKENDPHIQYKIGNVIKKVYVVNLDDLCKKENIDIEDLIDSIVIAPKSQQNIEDLKWYCKRIGLDKIANRIEKSDCPLR